MILDGESVILDRESVILDRARASTAFHERERLKSSTMLLTTDRVGSNP